MLMMQPAAYVLSPELIAQRSAGRHGGLSGPRDPERDVRLRVGHRSRLCDYRHDFMLWGPCRCMSLCRVSGACAVLSFIHSFRTHDVLSYARLETGPLQEPEGTIGPTPDRK